MSNKNDNRLKAMRHAGRANFKAIEAGMAYAIANVGRTSTADIDELMENVIRSNDCEPAFKGYRDYPATACISINDMAVHGIPDETIIQHGDIVTIDVGTRYLGWCVDAARSFVLEQPSPDEGLSHQFLIRCNLMHAAGGILGSQLTAVRNNMQDNGFVTLYDIAHHGECMAKHHGVNLMVQWGGHQIGETIHIEPFIPNGFDHSKGSLGVKLEQRRLRNVKLFAGMTICLEPVVTFGATDIIIDDDGWTVRSKDGGDVAHTERCLLITEDGYELLS